jgi:TolA-binding protein
MDKIRLHQGIVIIVLGALAACAKGDRDSAILPPAPVGAQALALTGQPLASADPAPEIKAKYDAARRAAEAAPADADKLIWHGRWAAYAGDHREAIRVFTRGIVRFPDLDKAVSLIEGKPDEVEPDGNPNPRGIPVSTLHSNVYYHLGLAHYLSRDMEKALAVYRRGLATAPNDDMRVATAHWLYMTLRRLGREEEAKASLEPIRPDMDIVENEVYLRLCLFYKGGLGEEAIAGPAGEATTNDAAAYGLGNWRLYNGDAAGARTVFRRILEGRSWASFGYIAAEAEVAWEMIH